MGAFIRDRKGPIETDTGEKEVAYGGRDWSDAHISQGMPRVASKSRS